MCNSRLSGDGGASFVFENATVIAPDTEITIALGYEKDQLDPHSRSFLQK